MNQLEENKDTWMIFYVKDVEVWRFYWEDNQWKFSGNVWESCRIFIDKLLDNLNLTKPIITYAKLPNRFYKRIIKIFNF